MMRAAVLLMVPLMLSACMLEPADELQSRQAEPVRDQWRVELDAPLRLEGDGAVRELLVGGVESNDNFANRGDVIVHFHDEDRIVVEMRRFTRASSPQQAEDDFERLSLWAYVGGDVEPTPPSQMEFANPCEDGDDSIRNRCGLRVYYDGVVQPLRTGADLRVTLPARYEGMLQVITEDSIVDADYLNRGNVCVEPTRARVAVQLERGTAYASVAPATVAPDATPSIELEGDAADLWLDVPAELRTSFWLGYEDDTSKQERCWADSPVEGLGVLESSFGRDSSYIAGTAGPDPAPTDFDVVVSAKARTCDVVAFTESPQAWVGEPNEQDVEVRGVPHLCNGCVRTTSCDQWLSD